MRGPGGIEFDALLCDMDGVLYRGDIAIRGAPEAAARLRELGVRVLFCTNNSRSTVGQYVDKLAGLGVRASEDDILTSAVVAREVLEQRGMNHGTAIVVGGDGLREAVNAVGLAIDDDPSNMRADLVAVGWDPGFTYEAMKRACVALRQGADFLATNDDASFPAAEELWPGAGAILASIEVGSGRHAEVVGKPHRAMMEAAARRLADRRRIAVAGDRADTDLDGGRAMGWTTVLVLSGVTTQEQARSLDPPPDAVVATLADLVQ
jgi:4-nitrophenyl phosphatase